MMQSNFCRHWLTAWLMFHTCHILASEPLRFDRDIRPILSDKCFYCHGPDQAHRQADLRLDLEEAAKRSAIVPKQSSASELVRRILTDDVDELMPPPESNKTLTADEKQMLERWIDEGAGWSGHWSFVPASRTSPIPPRNPTWGVNPIDAFVLESLHERGLRPQPEAARTTLIRRLSFDLTGLPPTLEEVDAFLTDESPDAYEKVVDRLLGSKHFGERMAVMWMDAARYGDTSVYHADGPRDMWAWRDTVVKAYNDNMPFNRFSIAQLAGDLLPNATLDEKILAGFNRNNGTTDEGGAIAEEYRVEYAVDRVKTTSTVWLGLSMECAQCHDHKYDPISQEDYYRFFAFFNISADSGMQTRDGNAEPTIAIHDPEKTRQLPVAEKQLAETREQLAQHVLAVEPEFIPWLAIQEENLADTIATPPGAILQVDFREGQGKQIHSADGTQQGTIQGPAKWINTPHDSGFQFTGDNYIDFGDIGNFDRHDSFSYGGWVKPVKGTGAMIARMDDGNQYRGYDLYVSTGPISVHIIHSWPSNAIKVTTKQKLNANEWYHVFATYDGSSQASGVKIFVNGDEWDWNIEQNGLTEPIQTEKSLLIGSRHPGSRFVGEIDSVQVFDRALSQDEVAELAKSSGIKALLTIPSRQRTDAQNKALHQYFLTTQSDRFAELQRQQAEVESKIAELKKPMTTVMIMGDMGQPRDTFVLNRGAYDSPTDKKVEPGTPSILPPMADSAPRNRLGLAQWLFDDQHPLTARVATNRYWQLFFGTGLVSTPEDFGSQGEYPSHPELLDWLAEDFVKNNWNIKSTIKQIVMSATYRQDSRAAPETYLNDPLNRQLSRGPRFRLPGEFIRDSALSLGGLLNERLGGPGVKPYQPQGLWVEVGLSGKPAFIQDHNEKLFRRSLYTYWKRSAPPPSMQIFDAPTREKCIVRRARTNTPLQALVVLNDPQFVEASRHFAERILACEAKTDAARVAYAFRLATARAPSELEIETLQNVLRTTRTEFQQSPSDANELLSVGESPRDESHDPIEHAAWTVLANTILNLDETLTRE